MPLLSSRSPVLPSDGVTTNRPDGGQHCDGTDEIKPVSSHNVVRWLREAPSPSSRRIVGKARSRSIPESDRDGWTPPQYPRSQFRPAPGPGGRKLLSWDVRCLVPGSCRVLKNRQVL